MFGLDSKEAKEMKRLGRMLRTSFSGKGIDGLEVLLKSGCVLDPIGNEREVAMHNDRIDIIYLLVGPEQMPELIHRLCKAILELSRDLE
jgi:hypothetical protein